MRSSANLDLMQQEKLAVKNKDCSLCLSIAQTYKDQYTERYVEPNKFATVPELRRQVVSFLENALIWFARALQYKPADFQLGEDVVKQFFTGLDHLRSEIFIPEIKPYLPLLSKIKSIKALIVKDITPLIADYVGFSQTITYLKLDNFKALNSFDGLCDDIIYLAQALRVNTSIKTLDFYYNQIGSYGVTETLKALANNKQNKVQEIDLDFVRLNDSAADEIINYLKNYSTLEKVLLDTYLTHQGPFDDKYQLIQKLLAENNRKNAAVTQAKISGAAMGFFPQIGLTKDLGYELKKHLTQNEANNLVCTAKGVLAMSEEEVRKEKLKMG